MNTTLKSFLIIVLKFTYGIFCTMFSLYIMFFLFIILLHSFFTDNGFDFQIIFFTFLSAALIIGFWSLIFVKKKPLFKILIFLLLLGVQLNYLKIFTLLPSVKKIFDMELCIDMGICPEGIKMKNSEGVLFEINKENCIKYGYQWEEQNRSCDMEIESRACEEQGYKWNIIEGKCSHKIIKDW